MAGKFRNIRVRMKGGRSRIQRAMVLASGKLKFVKNLSRSRATSARHQTKTRRSVRTTTKRRRGSSASTMAGIERAAKTVAFLAPVIGRSIGPGDYKVKVNGIVMDYTGYNLLDHSWSIGALVNGWGPGVATTLALKVAHKVMGIVRRI